MDEAGRADLGTGHHGPRQVGHVHAGLGAVAATLVTRAASDAGLPDGGIGWRDVVRHDGGRCVAGSDPELSAGGAHRVGRSVAGHRRQRVAPIRIPRVGWRPGHADEALDARVERAQFIDGDRPIRTDPLFGLQAQVARVGARHEGAPMQGGAADSDTAVIGPEGLRGVAGAQPLPEPIELGGRNLVRRVLARFPVSPGFQRYDLETRFGEPGQKRRAARAGAHHDGIDHLVGAVAFHTGEVHGATRPLASGSQGSRSPAPRRTKPCLRSPSPPLAMPP